MSKLHTIGTEKWPSIGFGAMGMAAFYQPPLSQPEVDKVLSTALDQGCTFWDTANVYSKPGTLGDNERQIGAFLRSHPGARERVFLATKFGIRYAADGTRSLDGSREWCHQACEGSLQALGVDKIDLYYAHRPADNVEVEETMEALRELKEAGKIRYIGVSEFTIEQLERAEKIVHIDAFQIEISPWTPEVLSNGMLEWCEKNGTAIVAYSPLGRGFLTGKIKSIDDLDEKDFRRSNPRFQGDNFQKNLELVDAIRKIAERKKASPGQIALAWLLTKSERLFVIPGTTSPERLVENVGAAKVELGPDEVAEMDGIIKSFKTSGERYAPGMKRAF